MFEPENESPAEGDTLFSLSGLAINQLLSLRTEIDSILPPLALNKMNLEEELVLQFQTAKAFQMQTLAGCEESNKKASTLNACTATLQNLVKMQAEYHTAERLKNIESRLIKALDKVPREYLVEFFDRYEKGAV